MTTSSSVIRRVSYGVFRRLPAWIRRTLVRHITPNYTVGAVVLVQDAQDSLLLMRQPRSSGWSLPGGLISRGESPARGAARELREETGLTIPSTELVPANPNARVSSTAQQIDMVFTARIDTVAPDLTLDPVEVGEAGWQSLDRLPPLTPATARLLGVYGIGPLATPARMDTPGDSPGTSDEHGSEARDV